MRKFTSAVLGVAFAALFYCSALAQGTTPGFFPANTFYGGPATGTETLPAPRKLVGADLPNPSVSTLGGVESLTCGANAWLSSISVAGVPVCTTVTFGAIAPTPTRAGDVIYWNGTAWVTIAGNNSGTQVLSENSSGVPAWLTPTGTGTVTSVTITAGSGVDISGTCPTAITTTGTCAIALSAARRTLPTSQTFTSGTNATYTTPANALWLEVWEVGGGGGGGGIGTSGASSGGTGGTTSFNSITVVGGTGGSSNNGIGSGTGGPGGTGGTGGAITRVHGQQGGGNPSTTNYPSASQVMGPSGGNSCLGFGAPMNNAGAGAAGVGFGAGGEGSGTGAPQTLAPADGGGGGECAFFIINSPSTTYTYSVGPAGSAGGAGASGSGGGAGTGGYIQVIEHYN